MIHSAELFGTPTQTIMDPVHGSIPIFSHEQKVLDDKLFQRLRHILQNDVLFLVFPGAKHNRLLHSMGTMHMVSSLFQHITSSYLANKLNLKISQDQRFSIQYLHCCLRLAGLLHDTGHSPFSHQFEQAEVVHNLLTPELYQNSWQNEDYKQFYLKDIEQTSHEHISVRVSYEILNRQDIIASSGLAIEDILFFLETTENEASEILLMHCKNFLQIFVSNIDLVIQVDALPQILKSFLKFLKTFISGELDADKMDYILRDSYFSGCRYGVYNKDHLLNSLRIGYEPFIEKTNDTKQIFDIQFSLAVLEKGVGALEDFIYARYQLYLELYNHKTVSGFRKLLTLSLEEVLSIEDNKNEVKCMLLNLDSFANFTDTFFWEKFREYARGNCRSACYMLVNRVTLPYIGKRTNEVENDIMLLCQRLSKTKNKRIDYWKSKIKFSDIDEAFNYIKVLVNQEDGTRKLKKIPRVTDFFAKFDRKDIYHLFEIPIN